MISKKEWVLGILCGILLIPPLTPLGVLFFIILVYKAFKKCQIIKVDEEEEHGHYIQMDDPKETFDSKAYRKIQEKYR